MKVAVVGTGNVGSALLFHLAGVPNIEKILVMNIEDDWSQAAIMDVAGANPEAALKFEVASFDRLGDVDLIGLTSGAQMEAGQTGKDVLNANIKMTKSILDSAQLKKSVFVIALATPVDEVTNFIQNNYKLPENQVMGFGGDLDRNRLSFVLTQRQLPNDDIEIIGEHGGRTIPVYPGEKDFEVVSKSVRNFLGNITVQGGRPRNLASGLLFAKLIDSIINNAHEYHYISGFHPFYKMYVTWPYIVGDKGVGAPKDITIGTLAQNELNNLIDRKREESK